MLGIKNVVAPVTTREFWERYWGRESLYVPGAAAKFDRLFSWADINNLLNYGQFAPGQVRLIHDKKTLPEDAFKNFVYWLSEGATLVFNSLQRSHPQVSALASNLAADVNSIVNVNSYTSFPAKQGFDIHFDGHDVFIIQTEGEKKWTVYEPTVSWPQEKQAHNRPSPPTDHEPYLECTMTAGDVLYIPRGHWHHAVAVTPSIHLTAGPQARSGIDFLRWLTDKLEDNEAPLRRDFPLAGAPELGGDREDERIETHLEDFRRRLGEVLNREDLMEDLLWFSMEKSHRQRTYQLPYIGVLKDTVTPETVFRLAAKEKPLIRYEKGSSTGKALLRGAMVDVQHAPEGLLETIFEGDRLIRGSELMKQFPELEWRPLKNLLMRLYHEGLVLISDAGESQQELPTEPVPAAESPRPADDKPVNTAPGPEKGHDQGARARERERAVRDREPASDACPDAEGFDDDWKVWIWSNIARGCSKDGIFKILIDEGFSYDLIRGELGYEPSVGLDFIANPLSGSEPEGGSADLAQGARFANAIRVESRQAELYVVDGFLNEEECGRLAETIRSNLRPSTITNLDEPDKEFRTSSTCDLSAAGDPLVDGIDERICRYLGIDPSCSEPLQGQHYEVGQQFKPHTDYFEDHEIAEYGGDQGQRTWTFMVYLNEPDEGGATLFPNLSRSFEPREGRAVFWNNLYPDGRPNPDTRHYGTPVQSGTKTIITKWFRGKGEATGGHVDTRAPVLTRRGFEKAKIPDNLYESLLDYYREHEKEAVTEVVEGFIDGPGDGASELIELTDELRNEIHATLQSPLEDWSGIALQPTYVYGIRRYKHGAVLKPHRDRAGTHIVSAVLNLAQDVEEDWPLEIEDHFCRRHQVTLAPGDMLLYEGGRLRHGRPEPLKGRSYANVFVHYRPREA